jgi:hypothetical protein
VSHAKRWGYLLTGPMSQSSLLFAILPIFLALSCNGSQTEEAAKESMACVPGESRSCSTTSGCDGAQVCADDGMSFGVCQCDVRGAGGVEQQSGGIGGQAPDDSSSGGRTSAASGAAGEENATGGKASGGASASTSSPGGTSSGGAELSHGGKTVGSGGAGDDRGARSSGLGGAGTAGESDVSPSGGQSSNGDCLALDMTDYPYPAYVAARYLPGSCTDEQAGDYFDDCVMSGNCTAYEAGGELGQCGACLEVTPREAEAYGPLLSLGEKGVLETNVAGCVEILGEKPCAPKLQVAALCESFACQSGCADAQAETMCMMSARSSSCDAVHEQTSCITTAENVQACSGTDFRGQFLAVARVFCQ